MQDICYVTHVKGSLGPKGVVTHRLRPTALETAIFYPRYESSDRQHRVVLTFLQKDECLQAAAPGHISQIQKEANYVYWQESP